MAKAVWNGTVLAEAEKTVVVEGNHYFPIDAVNMDFLKQNNHHTTCFWKGEASYYDVEVNGETNQNAAFIYPTPSDAAKHIKDHIAFWRGVKVEV